MSSEVKIFISYAHNDEQYRKALEQQLMGLSLLGLVSLWNDREISPGSERLHEIDKHLNEAHIILLLVSPDYLISEYLYSTEMKRAMERHERKEAIVIPIILRRVDWKEMPFGKLQALPVEGEYIASSHWHNQDEAFFDVAQGIRKVIESLVKKQVVTTPIQDFSIRFRRPWPPVEHSAFHEGIKRLCPCCIEEFYPGDCQIVSRITGEILKPAPTGWMTKQLARQKPEPLDSPQYLSKQASRKCPNPECGYLLPYSIERAQNVSIAVVGDISSGKTTYLSALFHEIEERWVKNNSRLIQAKCLTEYIKRDYLEPYIGKTQHVATHPNRSAYYEPLIYELKFRKTGNTPAKQINLILYDGSGEDQTSLTRAEYYARYILYASAIIFLVDPIGSMSDLRQQLGIKSDEELGLKRYRAYQVFDMTLELFKSFYGTTVKERLRSIPLAIMFSKSDLFKYMVPATTSFRFLSHYAHPHYLDLDDRRIIDKEVRRLLEESQERVLLKLAKKFSSVNFFASAATGCSTDATGHYPFVDPCRCLDPLLWILSQLEVIGTQ